MKVRSDFVSNSSSTSFIIQLNMAETERPNLDERFIKLICRCKYIYFYSGNSAYSNDLIDKMKESFGNCVETDENSIELDVEKLNQWNKGSVAVMLEILANSDHVTCSYGCDDCGEYVGEATQVCTVLELLYGIVAVGDGHFDYSSIKRLGVDV